MKNKDDKIHWYDGIFYDSLIAPNQDTTYGLVKSLIKPDTSIIDIGCGTGRFCFQIENRCSQVVGVDLSSKNINQARKHLQKKPSKKIEFYHSDVIEFFRNRKQNFDNAFLSYVIHEINSERRVEILRSILEHSDKLIIADYLVPRSKSFWNILNEIIEFLAGSDHYNSFKSYVREGGIPGLAEKAGLKIENEIKNQPKTSHIVVISN